jgi:3-keto-disaccharide hydrolase
MRPLSALVSLVIAAAAVAAEPDKDGFVPLFNGKDLTGWVPVNVHPKTFHVKDGEIITTGQPIGYMRTDKQYENFILEMEWMHVNKTEVGNSGLFVWGDALPVTGSPFTRGIEVQVLVNLEYKDKKGQVTATSHGDVFAIQGATCKPDRPHPNGSMRCLPSEYRAKGGGEWNHYRVEAKDGVIKLSVNGKEVSGVSECKPRKGYLALESEGAECHFRKLKIKELPSSNPKPEEVGTVDPGYKLLFNGLDLDGWKTEEGAWKAAGGHLRATGNADLVSEKTFGRFELVFDCKMPAGSKAEWWVEFGKDRAHLIGNPDNRGKWTRISVTVSPDEVAQTKDGRPAGSVKRGVGPGPIRFKPAEGLELMNVFVRELK